MMDFNFKCLNVSQSADWNFVLNIFIIRRTALLNGNFAHETISDALQYMYIRDGGSKIARNIWLRRSSKFNSYIFIYIRKSRCERWSCRVITELNNARLPLPVVQIETRIDTEATCLDQTRPDQTISEPYNNIPTRIIAVQPEATHLPRSFSATCSTLIWKRARTRHAIAYIMLPFVKPRVFVITNITQIALYAFTVASLTMVSPGAMWYGVNP